MSKISHFHRLPNVLVFLVVDGRDLRGLFKKSSLLGNLEIVLQFLILPLTPQQILISNTAYEKRRLI